MSDIPVGSPPVPPGRHAAPSGWYADPVDPHQERYWDGWQWSRNVRPRAAAASQPAWSRNSVPAAAVRGGGLAGTQGGRQATQTADGVRLASWWLRAVAAVIDNIISSCFVVVLAFPAWRNMYNAMGRYFQDVLAAQSAGTLPPAMPPDLVSVRDQILLTVVSLAVGFAYQMILLRWRSATLGKLMLGLRVVPVDRGRFTGTLEWNSIGLRAAVWVLPGVASIFAVVTLLDVAFPLWHPKRQALHDLAAKTQVVRVGGTARA